MKISEDDDGDGGFLSFWHKGDEEEEDKEKKKEKKAKEKRKKKKDRSDGSVFTSFF
jgi:hypothetical protein